MDTVDEIQSEANELPDELLEQLSGGTTEDHYRVARTAVSMLKQRGTTKERAMAIFALTDDPEVARDIVAYIDQNWDNF